MDAAIVIIALIWFGVTFGGAMAAITSKKLLSSAHMTFRKHFDAQATIGILVFLLGVLTAILFFWPIIFH